MTAPVPRIPAPAPAARYTYVTPGRSVLHDLNHTLRCTSPSPTSSASSQGRGWTPQTTTPIGRRRNKVTRHWFTIQGWPMGILQSDAQPSLPALEHLRVRPRVRVGILRGLGWLGGGVQLCGEGPHHKQQHRLDEDEIKQRHWFTRTGLTNGRRSKLRTTLPSLSSSCNGWTSWKHSLPPPSAMS
jgi:hypothetical protein